MPNPLLLTSARLPCCAPFCGRTTAKDKLPQSSEWLCQNHWRLVPLKYRRLHRSLKKRLESADAAFFHDQTTQRHRVYSDLWTRAARAWERCKAEAFKRIGDHP